MNYTKNEGATNATENIISKKRGRGGRKGGMLTTLVNATVERHNYK